MVTLRSAKPTCAGSIPAQASMTNNEEAPYGMYKHHKGNTCKVLTIARHSETLEPLIVYKAQYSSPEFGDGAVWG